MTARAPFVTLAEIQARHPRELAIVAADEATRVIDPVRIEAACRDASTEIRTILASRYTPDNLDRLDDEGAGVLRVYAIDIVMYRVSLSFGRSSEQIRDRYSTAVKRLEAISRGTGALTFQPGAGGGAVPDVPAGPSSPNEVVVDVPERMFTRRRFGGAV